MASELQIEIAAKLRELDSQKAVAELGYNKGTVSKVAKKLKKGWKPEEEETPGSGTKNQERPTPAKVPIRKVGGTIEVGKIMIKQQNWNISPHAATLILDTYHRSRTDINYGGSIGEFICDIFVFHRRIVGYTQMDYPEANSEEIDGFTPNLKEGAFTPPPIDVY